MVPHASLAGSPGSLAVADTETLYSVSEVGADRIVFGFRIAAPADQKASDLLKEPLSLKRAVRREDLTAASRVNLSWGSDDPDMFSGIEVPASLSTPTGGAPLNLGGLMAAPGVERHYYRGTLKLVERWTS